MIENFTALKGVWDAMNPDEKAAAWDNYANSLWDAYKAGVEMESWRERQALQSQAALEATGLLVGATQETD